MLKNKNTLHTDNTQQLMYLMYCLVARKVLQNKPKSSPCHRRAQQLSTEQLFPVVQNLWPHPSTGYWSWTGFIHPHTYSRCLHRNRKLSCRRNEDVMNPAEMVSRRDAAGSWWRLSRTVSSQLDKLNYSWVHFLLLILHFRCINNKNNCKGSFKSSKSIMFVLRPVF